MTLGVFLPLVTAVVALAEIAIFVRWRSSGRISETVFPIFPLASAAVPVALYVVLNFALPETGAIELF